MWDKHHRPLDSRRSESLTMNYYIVSLAAVCGEGELWTGDRCLLCIGWQVKLHNLRASLPGVAAREYVSPFAMSRNEFYNRLNNLFKQLICTVQYN